MAVKQKRGSVGERVHIRWMIRRDMKEVQDIEDDVFEFPWTEEDFIRCLRQRNCIGMVCEYDEKVVGYMIYELHRTRLNILVMAVHRDLQGQSVGKAMINKLVGKLSPQRRSLIVAKVRERNLPAQLFFRECGFRCVDVLRDHYEEVTEDALWFEYRFQG